MFGRKPVTVFVATGRLLLNGSAHIEFDPDRRVQQRIDLVFVSLS